MRKLPPFGAKLAQLLSQGLKPSNDVYLFIGNKAWAKGNNSTLMRPTRTLILPPWLSASTYEWPVRQCDILIIDTGFAEPPYIEHLTYCLYKDGADIVRFVSPDFELTVYHKE